MAGSDLPVSGDHIDKPGRHLARAGFGIATLEDRADAPPVTVNELGGCDFQTVMAFDCSHRAASGNVVVVPPLSGVLPGIVRGLILGLLPRYRVLVPEWVNPRFVPLAAGRFGLGDNISGIIHALHLAGPGAGLVSLCQSGMPSLAATAVMEAADDPAAPAALALLGAPIDAAANPTGLTRHLASLTQAQLGMIFSPVPLGYPGAGRLVYSAALQRALTIAARLRRACIPQGFGWNPFPDMAEVAELSLAEHISVMVDVDARHYRENIDAVFRRRALATGGLVHEGRVVDPAAVRRCAILVIEGQRDRIIAPGQTSAAHALCPDLPQARRRTVLAPGCNHLSLFRGEGFHRHVLPAMTDAFERWLA